MGIPLAATVVDELAALSALSASTVNKSCTHSNGTAYYGGIPENLTINVIIWLILLVVFCFLRKLAWDYGRIALVSRSETRFLTLFYGDQDTSVGTEMSYLHESLKETSQKVDKPQHGHEEEGFISWIAIYFKVTDERILQRSGRDAIQYLTFQRYLLVYMVVVVVICIGIILPVNFMGEQESDKNKFGRTTISNVQANSRTLWVHSVFAVVMLAIVMMFMRHFSIHLQYEEDEQVTRTLMISHIPKHLCFKSPILQHFTEAYPEMPVQDVQFAYDIRRLVKVNDKRRDAWDCWRISETIYDRTKQRPIFVNVHCGFASRCCRCCKQVDAIDYYKNRELKYRAKTELEKPVAFNTPLGIAFVTFENRMISNRVFVDFQMGCKSVTNPSMSSVSSQLNVPSWEVKYAPAPENIFWQNLALNLKSWWCRAIWVNSLLGFFLFFLTTPTVVLSLLYQVDFVNVVLNGITIVTGSYISQFIPALLLWLISVLMPILVQITDTQLIGHWTKSAQHYAVMLKSYIFLILMILILPSLGLTSAKALLEWFTSKDRDFWGCIFLPDNGAFFINYVITAAFIGTVFKLLRLGELILYVLRLAWAKSEAERTCVRRSAVWEFDFGAEYAYMMCVFAIVMAYSLVCPLITPFGLVYFILKYAVDRYNIYFVYNPSRIDKKNHAAAINFVIFGVILLQFFVTFFIIIRANELQGISLFSVLALLVTLFIMIGRTCFGWFRPLSPITFYRRTEEERERISDASPTHDWPFVASVLSQETDISTRSDIESQPSYGTLTDSTVIITGERKNAGTDNTSECGSV